MRLQRRWAGRRPALPSMADTAGRSRQRSAGSKSWAHRRLCARLSSGSPSSLVPLGDSRRDQAVLAMPGHINVFVSYSHADASLVTPVVRLLRVNQSLVFQDADGIAPGTKWRDEIAKALSASNLVVVFWCQHAFRSNEVSSEWRAAIEQGKDVLPLLLDATPL